MKVDIVCPLCHEAIEWVGEKLDTCKNPLCVAHDKEVPFINGKYILVDFHNSVIDTEVLQGNTLSQVERNRYGLAGLIKGVLSYTNPISKKNFSFLEKILLGNYNKKVLIIGGGELGSGIKSFVDKLQPIVIDVYINDNVDILADAHSLPFASSQFDLVIIQAVLEHVVEPTEVVKEIHRVLNSEGLVYAETPFMQQVHEGAYDFQRFTRSGHRFLFRDFTEIDSGVLLGLYVSFAWSVSFLVRGISRSHFLSKLTLRLLLAFRFIDRLIPSEWHSYGASAFYFLGRKSQAQMSHMDIIKYYKHDTTSS